jgi:hypothetical protein
MDSSGTPSTAAWSLSRCVRRHGDDAGAPPLRSDITVFAIEHRTSSGSQRLPFLQQSLPGSPLYDWAHSARSACGSRHWTLVASPLARVPPSSRVREAVRR